MLRRWWHRLLTRKANSPSPLRRQRSPKAPSRLRLEALEDRRLLAVGVLDTTFGGGTGIVTTNFGAGAVDHVNAVTVQANGQIVVTGVSNVNGTDDFALARYNSTGLLDTTFGPNHTGLVTTGFGPGSTDVATSVAVQTDGRIVVAGNTDVKGGNDFVLARYNADGTLDNTFGAPVNLSNPTIRAGRAIIDMFGGDDHAVAVKIQADGRIVIAGNTIIQTDTDGPVDAVAVARALPDGTQDSDFAADGKIAFNFGLQISNVLHHVVSTDTVTGLALQLDGQIVVAGYTNLFPDFGLQILDPHGLNIALARINAIDGTLDAGFGAGGLVVTDYYGATHNNMDTGGDDIATGVAIQGNGKIVIGGVTNFPSPTNDEHNFLLARYNSGGQLDGTFSVDGLVATDFGPYFVTTDDLATSIAVEHDDKILLVGTSKGDGLDPVLPDDPVRLAFARYNPDGLLDQTFGSGGKIVTTLDASTLADPVLAIQPDEQVVVAGTAMSSNNGDDFAVARFTSERVGKLQFASPTYSVSEHAAFATITVLRTDATDQTVSATYVTSDGTANAGADYAATTGTITFAPLETIKTFTVPILDDTINEFDETVNLTLIGNGLGAQTTAVLTILDDDPQPKLSITDTSMMEGNVGQMTETFSVFLSGPSGKTITVDYSTADGTATVADNDYVPKTDGHLVFAPGETGKGVTVTINTDTIPEPDETFFVNLSNITNAVISRPQGIATIVNDDQVGNTQTQALQFETGAFSVAETGIATITVSRINGSSGAVTVHFATSNGSALAGSDYTATSGTLTFANGETSKTFTVAITPDNVLEANETVNLTLSAPTGGAILGTPATAVLTILDSSTPNERFVAQLYRDLLGREADPNGLAFFKGLLDQGKITRSGVARALEASVEYQTLVVKAAYQAILKRDADPSGLAGAVGLIANGHSIEELDVILAGSLEYFQNRGGGTNAGFLAALFQDGLNRQIEASAQTYFGQLLAAGISRGQIAGTIFFSTEHLQQVIQGYYQLLLHRNADSNGLTFFATQLQQSLSSTQTIVVSDPSAIRRDTDVIAILAGSEEYFARLQ